MRHPLDIQRQCGNYFVLMANAQESDNSMNVPASRVVEWLSRLVRVPSVGPANTGARSGAISEAALAAQVAEWLRSFGGEVTMEDVHPGRPNVYGIWRAASDRWLAVDVHLDTVGVETMQGDPFDGRVEGGRVYGRGAVDTKASMAIVLALLEALQGEGRSLPHNLIVCASADEETGCYGAAVFRRWVEQRGLHIDQLLVAEPTLCAPVYGHKGSAGVVLEIEGVAAHSSKPHLGRNAITAAAPVISALAALGDEIAAQPAQSALGAGTLSITMIHGGQAHNIIPDRCILSVDRRLVVGEDADAAVAAIQRAAERACPLPLTLRQLHALTPFYQPPDTPWVRQLAQESGVEPDVATYGTNASHYNGLAGECVIFGPGSIDQAHRDIEWIDIAELEKAARIYERWWGLA
jgi:acetylornithine deacetylase/succinyl-diaminopimelate desuccinylase-like protein